MPGWGRGERRQRIFDSCGSLPKQDPASRREQRRAGAADVIDEITGEDASVMSRAVLVAGGQAAGIAEENFMAAFVKSLA